jgi:type VI secretion system secreted protein VgrG
MQHATLHIEGEELQVDLLEGSEGLSQLFSFELDCATDNLVAEPQRLLGRTALIRLRAQDAERQIRGIVARATRRVSEHGTAHLVCVVRPPAFRLTLGRECRAFHNKDVAGVVDEVLAQLPHRWELARSYAVRAYTVQYREDDWTFVSRLLEDEGIYYWFDHEDDSCLVLSDASPGAPELVGGAMVPFIVDAAMAEKREAVHELASEVSATATKFTIGSFDPVRPRLVLSSSAGDGALEMYDAPGGGPRSPEACERRASDLRDAAACARDGVAGTCNSVRLAPGRIMELSGHPVMRHDRRYLVTEARYRVQQSKFEESDRRYSCGFRAIASELPYRPPARSPRAQQAGLQSGVVVGANGEEIFPDDSGRVRVQLHWDRRGAKNDASGTWMRVAQRGTADSMLLPRIGWNVLTFNEEGAVDDPALLSRIHDAEHPPAYALPEAKTRVVFKTATSPADGSFNEVHFEDDKGREEMFMNASRDMNVLVHNNKTEEIRRDVTRSVTQNHDLGVGNDFMETVRGNQTVSVDGNAVTRVLGSRDKGIDKNESQTIAQSRSLHVGDTHANTVVGSRSSRVGTAMVEASLGPIVSTSGMTTTILVGGAAVKVSAQSMAETVMLGSVQAIGGAKLELAGGARNIQTKLIHLETVGGGMMLKTAGAFNNTAAVGASYTVGGLWSMAAPILTIEAKAKIVLACGGSSITITPDAVEIHTPKLDLSQSKLLDADGSRIDHN